LRKKWPIIINGQLIDRNWLFLPRTGQNWVLLAINNRRIGKKRHALPKIDSEWSEMACVTGQHLLKIPINGHYRPQSISDHNWPNDPHNLPYLPKTSFIQYLISENANSSFFFSMHQSCGVLNYLNPNPPKNTPQLWCMLKKTANIFFKLKPENRNFK